MRIVAGNNLDFAGFEDVIKNGGFGSALIDKENAYRNI
jgi:hypothetical protein